MAEVATRQRASDPASPARTSPHAPEPESIETPAELLPGGAVEARPGTALADGRLDPHRQVIVLRALQRTHGNAHVQRLLRERLQQTNARIQREAACPAPPTPAPPLAPKQDPKFQAVKGKVAATAAKEKQHPPAAAKATEAQNAATGPPNEVASQGAAGQVDTMARQEPGAFDKKAFIAAVRQAIERITPKTQEDADDFKSSGKAGQVKDQVTGMVTSGKEGAQKAIKDKTTEPPSPTGAPKPVTPMKAETPGPEPGAVGAASGMPSPKPAAELSLAHGKCETDAMMTDAGVTEPQIKKSNEPEFTGALDAKKKSDVHAATAPQEVKKEEQAALGQAKTGATALAGPAVAGMHSGRAAALTQVGSAKGDTKSQDEAKRAEIATKFEGIYNTTKTEVSAILTGLDAKVNSAFESGEKAARAAFENHVETRMNAYKDKRYGGLDGPALWLVDKLTSMPPEVNVFYVEGRNLYLSQMDGVIDNVAGIVERELGRAKARIAQGKKQIADEVAKLPKSLQAIGREAQQGITGKFEQLEQEVDAKQQALVDDLAQKYVEARNAVDTRIDEMKAANKGLLDYAKDAMGSVVETITKLKDMLLGVLAKASDVIDTIIADPIQFLSNLVSAIKMGLNQFVGNIGKHLKDGLMGWLLGELASAGITMPKSLDFKGILDLVLQIMGLTYNAIRSRAVKIVGEPVVKKIEQVAEVFKILITEGPAGLWKWIVEKVDNLVDTVLGGIKDLVITKVITAGITWLISLLNPASAFVKACKMIYDVIMFFVERGSQIMSLVNAILDSVGAIASGALGAAANFVEKSLAKALPVAISFLASLLGLGGLSDKIRKIIEQVQKPVGKAVDWVINGVVKVYKKVAGFVKGLFGKGDKEKEKKPDEQLPPSEGAIPPIPFAMAGKSHALYIEEKEGSVQVLMASANKERVANKFQPVKALLASYKAEIAGISDPAIRKSFEEELTPEITEWMDLHVEEYAGKIEGKKSKDRTTLLAEIQPLAEQLIAIIVAWADKNGIPDMTPKAIEKRAEEEANLIWRGRQAAVQAALEAFVPRVNALAGDGQATIEYRGSLARGHKHGGKGFADFDPNDFDVDAFIKSDALARSARDAGAPVIEGKIWGSRSNIPEIVAMVNEMRVALAAIGGMKMRGAVADFDLVIRSEREVRDLKTQPRAPGEEEKHVTIKAPTPAPAAPPAAAPPEPAPPEPKPSEE